MVIDHHTAGSKEGTWKQDWAGWEKSVLEACCMMPSWSGPYMGLECPRGDR